MDTSSRVSFSFVNLAIACACFEKKNKITANGSRDSSAVLLQFDFYNVSVVDESGLKTLTGRDLDESLGSCYVSLDGMKGQNKVRK